MKYDTIVVGAGAAGLAAARELSGRGLHVCLLEARPRIGGRILTQRVDGLPLPLELGAEFVHGEAQTTFDIVEAASLISYEIPDNHWWSREGEWELIPDFWGTIDRVRRKIPRLRRDVSFQQFLRTRKRIDARVRELAWTFVEGYHAAHADRISALALRSADGEQEQDDPAGNRQFRIASGYDRLMEWLLAGTSQDRCDVHLSTVVKEIAWREGDVVVEAQRGSRRERFRASAAVITIPIGVWKAPSDQEGAIRFDPALREKEQALSLLESGHVVKILFRFRERFWDDNDFLASRASATKKGTPLNFVHTSDRFMPTWWTMAPVRAPLLVGWAGGHAADAMLAEGPDARIDRALDSMASAFRMRRRDLDRLFVVAETHDWQADPFSRCAYSYAGVGGKDAHRALGRPLKGTLFFAGEATNGEETGTVAGAIDSGRRAARELLRKNAR